MTQEMAILERLSERACYLDKIGAECKLRLKAARDHLDFIVSGPHPEDGKIQKENAAKLTFPDNNLGQVCNKVEEAILNVDEEMLVLNNILNLLDKLDHAPYGLIRIMDGGGHAEDLPNLGVWDPRICRGYLRLARCGPRSISGSS